MFGFRIIFTYFSLDSRNELDLEKIDCPVFASEKNYISIYILPQLILFGVTWLMKRSIEDY